MIRRRLLVALFGRHEGEDVEGWILGENDVEHMNILVRSWIIQWPVAELNLLHPDRASDCAFSEPLNRSCFCFVRETAELYAGAGLRELTRDFAVFSELELKFRPLNESAKFENRSRARWHDSRSCSSFNLTGKWLHARAVTRTGGFWGKFDFNLSTFTRKATISIRVTFLFLRKTFLNLG